MANVSRIILDHPALGTTGGAALHASIQAIYKKLGDNIADRLFYAENLASAGSVDLEHNFGVGLADMRWDLYLWDTTTQVLTRITSDTTPALSSFAVAEKVGEEKVKLTLTNNSGAERDLVLCAFNDPIELGELTNVDLATTAPEDGQTLVYDSASKKFKPGASGDASFKVQSVSTPNATLKGGYLLLDDGRELATYDGAGSASTDFGKDLTVNLTTILGSSPADATAYYLCIDLNTLSSSTTQTDTGRVIYPITVSNMALLTTAPELTDMRRYVPRSVVKSATTGNAWSGTGASYATLAFLGGQTVGARGIEAKIPVNYIDVPSPTRNIGSAATYADAAAATPADGTGGSPNVTLVRNTTSPIRGIADYKFSKDAANRQGQGFAIPFTIPATDKGMKARIRFRYNASHASYAAGDLVIYVYDVTNSLLLTPLDTSLPKNTGVFETSFDLTTGTSYRLIGHVATTNASAYDVYFDDFRVDTERAATGNGISAVDVAYTLSGVGTATNTKFTSYRVGNKLRTDFFFAMGTTAASTVSIDLPSGYTIDYTKLSTQSNGEVIGYGVAVDPGAGSTAVGTRSIAIFTDGSTTNKIFYTLNTASASLTKATGNVVFNNGCGTSGFFEIPIAEWAGSVQNMGSPDVEYAYNSSTSTSTDTTSFAYGPAGILLTAHSGCTKRVRFTTAIQPTDRLEVEFREGISGQWIPLGHFTKSNGDTINFVTFQGATGYGASLKQVSGSTTDVDFFMSAYAQQAAASYAGAGSAWSLYTTVYWRVKKTRAGAAVGFGIVNTSSSGLLPATLSSLDDATATRMGLKQYLHGTTYNGGLAPTVTLSSGGGTLTSVDRAVFVPYQMQDGSWRLKFQGAVNVSSASRTSALFAINGITSKVSGGNYLQPFTGINDSGSVAIYQMYIPENSNVLNIRHAAQTATLYTFAGDIELASKPTWAY